MQIILTSSAILILLLGIYIGHSTRPNDRLSEETSKQSVENVLSEVDENSSTTPSVTLTPTDKPHSDSNSVIVIENNANDSAVGKNVSTLSLNEFRYISSQTVSESSNSLKLKSSDSPETITAWYKNKINDLGMNVTSFVTTQSNDVIKNKLNGADASNEVTVEINRTSSNSEVFIDIFVE